MQAYTSLLSIATAIFLFVGAPAEAAKAKAKVKSEATTLKISNLTTATKAKEIKKLEKAVRKIKGVTKVAISKKKGQMIVRAPAGTDRALFIKAVESAGFTMAEPKSDAPSQEEIPDDAPVDEPTGDGDEL